ncbi:MAG: helix-turn-helix domain-containing protein [Acidimicrobiia bacterium]|nr:helix-turn-helix domain-containing protein [Acidimicrobiia bacterium]MBV8560994.1 helix-turn-helix domain-containing protein [Acidimicrobiia bacterium]
MTTGGKRHTVAALAFDDAGPFELAVACEVFGIDRSNLGVPWYGFMVCSAVDRPVNMSVMTIDTPYRLSDLRRADTIIVPADPKGEYDEDGITAALQAAHRRGARIMSFCTGAFVLARAGLLDGRRATTHWAYAEEFARQFPAVKLDPGVLYVDEDDVLTSAGTAAGIDLCLHVVRKDHGADVANAVARRMVVPPHRDGGQAQYVDDPIPDGPGADLFGATIAWLHEHLDEPVTVEDLADRSAMSPRTFARRFRATTGTTPMQWVLRQRVLLAQRLLETTDEPVDRVAELAGFGSPASLRQHFQRIVRTSPTSYRRTFRREESVG